MREGTVAVAAIPGAPTLAERAALCVLQAGALLVVLASVTDRAFELDRFFIPKELVLHATAFLAGVLALGAFRRVALTAVDGFLVGFLLLGVASALLAGDRSLAARALAVGTSGVAVFWTARALSEAGLARPLLRALAIAVVLAAATALLQAYGVVTDFFSVNRAPGGTLGNRNSIAHVAAFGLPVVLLVALRAWRTAGYLLAALGVMTVVAVLVITRSRAGWLAFGVVILVFAAGMLLSRPLRRHGRTWRRLAGMAVLVGLGVAAAILLPNELRWRSENPYLESATEIVNYREGSGRGRVVQYGRSMRMAVDHPLLGVGPGNWSEAYPDYAAPGDPSLSRSRPGTTANPWPSSDWLAFVAERGFPAAILLALVLLGIAASAFRRLLRARDYDEGALGLALVATVLATIVAGAFDAVLLLAHPTLLVWAALGAMWSLPETPDDPMDAGAPRSRGGWALLLLVALGAAAGAVQSARQLSTMTLYGLAAAAPTPAPPEGRRT